VARRRGRRAGHRRWPARRGSARSVLRGGREDGGAGERGADDGGPELGERGQGGVPADRIQALASSASFPAVHPCPPRQRLHVIQRRRRITGPSAPLTSASALSRPRRHLLCCHRGPRIFSLTVARGFAHRMTVFDPNTEIPAAGTDHVPQRRRPPFACSAADITALMSAARRTPSPRCGQLFLHWNEGTEPFEWTATAASILDKVAMVAILNRGYRNS
jgi:hypothetical protein